MGFTASWSTLLTELEELPEGATLITPLSHDRFTISDIQEQRVIVRFQDRDIDPNRPLQRGQFETLYEWITDAYDGFELDRLPPDADAYPAVWSCILASRSTRIRVASSNGTAPPLHRSSRASQQKTFRRLIERNLTSPCMPMRSS